MKIKSLFLAAILMGTAATTFAQNESYNKVYVSFATGGASVKGVGETSDEAASKYTGNVSSFGQMGCNIGYAHGINLKKSIPLFLEVGGEIDYLAGSESGKYGKYDVDYHTTCLNFQIPVNVTYRFKISDKFAIAPFVGVNFKVNILGTCYGDNENYTSDTYSFFSKDDMKSVFKMEETANRFQIGMNVGVNFVIAKHFSVGYRCQPDFIDYFKYEESHSGKDYGGKMTTLYHNVTFGYIF